MLDNNEGLYLHRRIRSAAAVGVSVALLFNNRTNSDGGPASSHRRLGFLSHKVMYDPQTTVLKPPVEYLLDGKNVYYQTALNSQLVSDKVTRHSYQTMYGRFLLPYYYQKPKMKMLEIGLGRSMDYGPGASVSLYKTLFPQAELWEAEFVERCVKQHIGAELFEGINVLVGDQGDYGTLDRWISESGGNFDVVIDDGGQQNCQIYNSFTKLWPNVKPGGLYFIEDMEVARKKRQPQGQCDQNFLVPEKLKEMIDVLIYEQYGQQRLESDIEFVFCQADTCVLGKKSDTDPASVWWNKSS